MRRLNSRCTGQRPLSVQRIWPTIDAIEPSTLSMPHSSRSPRIIVPVFGLAAHFGDDILQYLAGAVGIFLVGDIDADGRIAGATAGIGDRRHGAERNDMHRAVAGAQADGSDRDVLDGARQAGHADVVTDLDGILQQQKQPGDEVLHQFLRPETDGDTDDTGARQQRARR